jgi:polyphenol oxidase
MTSWRAEAEGPPLPAVPPAFHWTNESWGSALRCRPLEDVARHLFTTRQLQLTDPDDVRQLGRALGVDRVAMVTQVHEADVVVVRRGNAAIESRPEADILVSNDPDVAIAVRAADCVPVLIADRITGAVAAVHAGWRGTAAGAARVAVDALGREFGARPENMVAAIGPSIGGCCYEVGTELVDAFAAAGQERYLIDRWFVSPPPARGSRERSPLFLDLTGANRDQLLLAGMAEQNVFLSGLCTAMNLEVLPSFRVEKVGAGRMAGAIVANRL